MNQYRLLLVDDYVPSLAPMQFFFERQGFAVTLASDGEEAVSRAASVDAIVMDTEMPPGIHGFEACKQIRKQPFGKHLVIIGASGREGYADTTGKYHSYRSAWLNADADAFLSKDVMVSVRGYADLNRMILGFFNTRRSHHA